VGEIGGADGDPALIGTVGHAHHNALMETINGLYKAECVRTTVFYPGLFTTTADVEYATAGWVDWYRTEGPTSPRATSRPWSTSEPIARPSTESRNPHSSGTEPGALHRRPQSPSHPSAGPDVCQRSHAQNCKSRSVVVLRATIHLGFTSREGGMAASRSARSLVEGEMAPPVFDRVQALTAMEDSILDVLVVGGGITGVSVALDSALRGLRVGLVERTDFASGTSSASSKMIHGGLRYIEQGQIRMVYESLLERQRMYRRAPHLVTRLPFLFPVYDHSEHFGPVMAKAFEGLLRTYDLAGGWRIGSRYRRLTAEQTLSQCPTLPSEGLRGGLLHFDTRTDDARLTTAIARTAALHGAYIANRAEVTELGRAADGATREVIVSASSPDGRTSEHVIRARVVVNATGIWADQIDTLADPKHHSRIRPAKGVHVVVPWEKVRSQSSLVFPMLGGLRGKGGRGFAVRWGDHCYIGTTDTAYDGDLDTPRCSQHEAEILLDSLNATLTTELTLQDITGTWAGLRPLIDTGKGSTAELSRAHEITVTDGVITVAGGKLTLARLMAQQAVDRVCTLLDVRRRCRTSRAPVIGGAGFDNEAVTATGGRFGHLSQRYGTEARFVEDLAISDPFMAEPVVEGLPYLWAEVLFAIRHEMATTVEDLLTRRIPARFLDSRAAAAAAEPVAALLARELGLSDDISRPQVEAFAADIATERDALGQA